LRVSHDRPGACGHVRADAGNEVEAIEVDGALRMVRTLGA
jgi:hypothetical protein